MQEVEPEKLLCLLHHFLRSVEALRVHFEDGRRIDREGTVDINWNRRDCAFPGETMERVDHLLSSTNRECGNEDATSAGSGLANYLSQLCSGALYGFVVPVSIGRFHDQGVSTVRRNWIPDYRSE